MKDYFQQISKFLFNQLNSSEILILNFDAEKTDFVRFNKGKIRQAGNVSQINLIINLIFKGKTLKTSIRLSTNFNKDSKPLANILNFLRREIVELPNDPYLMYEKHQNFTNQIMQNNNIDAHLITDTIIDKFKLLDMVGVLSSGNITKGFSNSLGQINWHESESFNFDWSVYSKNGKAIKQNYSDQKWNQNIFDRLFLECTQKLNVIDYQEQKITPGEYRVYLSPSAMNEIIDMMSWGGFSYKANKIGSSPLHLMSKGKKELNKIVSFSENLTNGISPKFHSDGFIKPEKTNLIVNGKYNNSLVSPRSSLEYSVKHNAAEYYESPVSIELEPGDIKTEEILSSLSDGIYLNNLWYLNFSDRNNGRITGLTRFGCFKVANGEYVGPINTMRFDETVYNILGEKLIGLTDKQQLLMDSSTYEERSTYNSTIPGALVDSFKMTL